MDILNWLYLRTNKLVKTKPNNPETDLIVLGADVTFQKRDDRYQTYAMSLQDAVSSVACTNDNYTTEIFVEYPYVVTPTMSSTCTFIENTDPVTGYPFNLEGHKIVGTIQFDGDQFYSYPIGTVIYPNDPAELFLPWQTRGSVSFDDAIAGIPVVNSLGMFNNALDSAGGSTYCQIYFIQFPTVVGNNIEVDIVMFLDPAPVTLVPAPAGDIECVVSFEYEFLLKEGANPTFVF